MTETIIIGIVETMLRVTCAAFLLALGIFAVVAIIQETLKKW